MTTEEAKRFLQRRIDLIDSDYPSETDYRDALVLAIKALEQCEVWDGIHGQVVAPKGTFDRIWNDAEKEKQEPKWIPASEKLPNDRDWYLGIFKEPDTGWINPLPFVCDYVGRETKATTKEYWILHGFTDRDERIDYYFNLECVSWQPLPKPYKESEEFSDYPGMPYQFDNMTGSMNL